MTDVNKSLIEMSSKFSKLDKFEGMDFRRWQKKMKFLLVTLRVGYVLNTPMPEKLFGDGDVETAVSARARSKWENDDFICRGHILNGMSDGLFDIYQSQEFAAELWDELEKKYMAEDASSKKFLVSNFNNYKMIDSRPVMEQYNELAWMLGQYVQYGLIDKLPPSWKEFKHMLKHMKGDLTLIELGSHNNIEQGLQNHENGKGEDALEASMQAVHIMDGGGSKPRKKWTKSPGNNKNKDNSGNNKTPGACWICGKAGHLKRDCLLKGNKPSGFKPQGKGGKGHGSNSGK